MKKKQDQVFHLVVGSTFFNFLHYHTNYFSFSLCEYVANQIEMITMTHDHIFVAETLSLNMNV